jgi:hypothetical protein
MTRTKTIRLSGAGLYNMLDSLAECWPNESTGRIFGYDTSSGYLVTNSYPIQTAERSPSEVTEPDSAAIKRLIRLRKARINNGNILSQLIGGFHIHPVRSFHDEVRRKALNHPGDEDLDFVTKAIQRQGLDYWIEIILRAKANRYKTKFETGEYFSNYEKRLGATIQDSPQHSYQIMISAHEIDNDGKITELRVRKKMKRNKN